MLTASRNPCLYDTRLFKKWRDYMIELGKTQCLNVVKKVDFGVYLGTEEDKVLLPKKMVPEDIEAGDALTVFVYRDSSDRLIATTKTPKVQLGQLAVLKVSQVSKIGAFLDWGLEKDLFMPFKDNKYFGMIPKNEVFGKINIGDIIYGRVSKVREDGKLTISLKQKAYIQMDEDSSIIYEAIKNNGGSLPFTDKASPEIIKEHFQMSKNAFKRAVGRLLKEGKIVINETSINMK